MVRGPAVCRRQAAVCCGRLDLCGVSVSAVRWGAAGETVWREAHVERKRQRGATGSVGDAGLKGHGCAAAGCAAAGCAGVPVVLGKVSAVPLWAVLMLRVYRLVSQAPLAARMSWPLGRSWPPGSLRSFGRLRS